MTDAETAPRCQWCSAVLPAADLPTCPSCGATLTSTTGSEPDIKGVTMLDPEAILRARAEVARPKSRLLSFITGDVPIETGGPTSPEALAAPDDAVRREMLRLEIEAERADLEAEAVAMKTDAVLEQGIDLATLGDADEIAHPAEGAGHPEDQPAPPAPSLPPPPPA
jgi:ribosomal protein S27E